MKENGEGEPFKIIVFGEGGVGKSGKGNLSFQYICSIRISIPIHDIA